MLKKERELLNFIAQIIFDKKGFNILAIDVKNISSLCDYMIIAEGSVDRHVKAIAENVVEEVKEKMDINPYKVEGRAEGDWIVIDYQNIIIHLFMPDLREKYQLEKLWQKGKVINLEINTKVKGNLA